MHQNLQHSNSTQLSLLNNQCLLSWTSFHELNDNLYLLLFILRIPILSNSMKSSESILCMIQMIFFRIIKLCVRFSNHAISYKPFTVTIGDLALCCNANDCLTTSCLWGFSPDLNLSVPFSFPGDKAAVAMVVLLLLLQGKSGVCKCTDFVEFISVSIISFI